MSENRKKIKIVEVSGNKKAKAETKIEDLVNQGLRIVAAGGGTGSYVLLGFVIL